MNLTQHRSPRLAAMILLSVSYFGEANAGTTDPIEAASNTAEDLTYPASFFEQYRPQNALEMVQRLPGFNADLGASERGFGGNAGNVLIDGARPTSKSGGLRAALARIPTAQVERIEILHGGVSSAEATGQSIVANIIRRKNVSSGRWALKGRWTPHTRTRPNLEVAMTTRLGAWDSSFDIDIGGFPGYRTAVIETADGAGQLLTGTDERYIELIEFGFINADGARDFANGKLTLNARIGGARPGSDTNRDIFDDRLPTNSSPDHFSSLRVAREFSSGELGIDWSRTAADWKWRVIGLGLVRDSQFENEFRFETVASGDASSSNFTQDALSTEFIARTTYGRVLGADFKPEFGLEIATNKLTSDSAFFEDGVQQALNGGDVEVEELRGELFSTFVYLASEKLTIEGGLTLELSTIEVSGDAAQKQTFRFIKPRISTTHKFNQNHRLVLEIERSVGQLNFNDFAASSQASDDRTTSGNPELRPDKTTQLSATYDWNFGTRGSLKIKAFHQWNDDILEQILLPSGGQGIGNAGNARFWGIQTDINLPIDFILKNGLLELSHSTLDSSFDDPIIDRSRTTNGFIPKEFSISLRQDLTEQQFAWGIEYFSDFTSTTFFVDEIQTLSGEGRWKLFIETSRFLGLKTQLEIIDADTADFIRNRLFFDGDRGGSLSGTEIARRQMKPQLKLSFFSNF